MNNHLVFEVGLALGLAAIAAVVAARLKFSNAPFLILMGMLVGPHAPHYDIIDLRFIETKELIDFMGRIGVLFLLFYLGLEFSISRLIKSGKSIAIGGSIYIAINFALGLIFAWGAGLPLKEILVVAGITTISSSAIVAKVLFDLKRTVNPETELILGIIMFEDVFLAFYLSLVSGVVLSGADSVLGVLGSAGLSLAFILGFIIAGRLATPVLNRILRISSNEVFILVLFACLFLLAGLGERIHVAEAIGALLLGLILAETQHGEKIESMVVPFRDFFGALFFFGFGLTIDPFSLGGAVWLALAAVVVTLIGNIAAGVIAGRLANLSRQASYNIGFTIVSRGEFSIIMANLAKNGGLLDIIQPFSALYVLILAVLGPVLTRESERICNLTAAMYERLAPKKQPEELEEAGGE